jgi:hypothetical protein
MQYLVGPGPGHVLKGVSAPGFNLGSGFNVPTGAFTFGPYVYLFVMTSLNSSTNPSGAQGQSLLLRAASESLFSSAGTTLAFDNKSTISSSQGAVGYKFLGVSPTVITNSDYPLATATSAGLPAMAGNYAQGVLMFGSGPYRGNAGISNLSLAWMPLDDSGPHPELRARERRSRPVNAARGAV